MGEIRRSPSEERRYTQRWLTGVVVGPLLVGALAAAWMVSLAPRLPAELATHWNSQNEVNGYTSLWGLAAETVVLATVVGGTLGALAIACRGQSLLLARLGTGLGVGSGAAIVSLMVSVVASQIDLVEGSRAELSGPVLAGGLLVSAVMGASAGWVYRPQPMDKTPNPEALAMSQAATAGAATAGAATAGAATAGAPGAGSTTIAARALALAGHGETLEVKVSMGPWSWVLSVGVAVVTGTSVFFIFPLLALVGVLTGGLTWIFTRGTAAIGPSGVKVLACGFWQVMRLGWKEILLASVQDIKALDYGGWGYRMGGGSTGFIMANGPAVVMEGGFHEKFVISMPDFQTAGSAAALVNAYLQGEKVKN